MVAPKKTDPGQMPPAKSLTEWMQGLEKLLQQSEEKRFHGKIQLSIFDGKINRVTLECSINDPSDLAKDGVLPV